MGEDLKLDFGHVEEGDSKGWFGRIREILRNNKPLNELIKEEKFLVEKVICNNEIVTTFVDTNPRNEYGSIINVNKIRSTDGSIPECIDDVFGDFTQGYDADNYKSTCYLIVTPLNKSCPIHTLTFAGYTPIIGGQIVSAKIAKYDSTTFRHSRREFYRKSREVEKQIIPTYTPFYTERPYNSIESALSLSLHDANDKVIREDRSVDYNRYFKDK